MKQTWPELKAQAHRSPCSVSQCRKHEQTHESLVCNTGAGLPAAALPGAPGRECKIFANSDLSQGCKGQQSQAWLCGSTLRRVWRISPPSSSFGDVSAASAISLLISSKGNEANTTPRSVIPPSSTLAGLVFLVLSGGRVVGAPWDPWQDTQRATSRNEQQS